jgi:hypothetical protein
LIGTLAALGDHAGAVTTAVELSRLGWNPPAEAYYAARALSLCVPVAANDGKRAEAQRKEQAQTYADRAMELLKQAVAGGGADLGHMKKATGRGLSNADVLHGEPDAGETARLDPAGVVELLTERLRQVGQSELSTPEKTRLTVQLTDALLRAIGVNLLDQRLEALQSVLLFRKDDPR